ncbi:MAG: gliding motility-associated C-terminal domain-containing protein [Phycisphaerae bacterium]|nr:gliding motility-associated C-terminal domain-containing protein [Saprospiraceae bacterium]
MNIKHILPFLALLLPFTARTQCSNPIVLDGVTVSNTQCGSSTGTIIINPGGGLGLYNFEWTPPASNSNVAINLAAGTYNVHIVRANNPNCILDTVVVVNNSNGPQVQVTISPAQCLASNGSISLTPTNLLFNWSNGGSGSTVTGLASKNYYVTVTNPNTGCYSIFKYFVPRNLNSLAVNTLVQDNAKCSMNNGKAQVVVTGGSGQYSYNPGPGPQYNNLAPGNYTVQVSDNATGCFGSTNFTIQNLQISGTVNITPHNVRCSGQTTGTVEFSVTPGQNFELPYVFTLKDQGGTSYSPGSLPAGTFTLQIADADGCTLPPQNFSINEPPAFNPQVQVSPETCVAGGQISLSITGGNGAPYIVNWADLPGDDNPEDRTNLRAGRYSAVVFDSLFCTYSIDTVLVAPNCNNLTNVHMVLGVNTTDFYCVPQPVGLAPGATTFSILGGGLNGSSAYGSWSLNSSGCLAYLAGSNPGFGLDTICIISMAPQIGLKDTTCVIVSITQQQPSKQSVFFSVLVNKSTTTCGSIPLSFTSTHILQLGRPGLSGTSDTYGSYIIDNVSACLDFFANNAPGFNVDEIRVAVFDTLANKCHIISYFPSVLPQNDCSSAVDLADTLHFITTGCNGVALGCVPIPYDDIVNYTIIDNGALYAGGYTGCAPDSIMSYNVTVLPTGGGPYELTEWKINGQAHTGNFLTFNGLVDLMNLIDPSANGWKAQGVGFIRGGHLANTYGPLKIKSAGGNSSVYSPSSLLVPLGTEMRFTPGFHKVVFRNVQTACSDTVTVDAVCFDCAPIHSYPLDAFGGVKWNAATCNSDTVFCTNILNVELGQHIVTDNGDLFINFNLCGNFVGMNLDTGLHQLHFRNTITTCEWNVRFYLECKNVLNEQTIPVSVPLGGTVNICLDTSFVDSPITSMTNICEDEGSDIIGYSFNTPEWCVQITGQNLGLDTLCVQLCNDLGECADYILLINVSGTPSDSLLAGPDAVFNIKNESLDFNIIANDIVGGIVGNLGGLTEVKFLSNPTLGTFTFNASNGTVSYTPEQGECGVDSFSYRITDDMGQQSIATIKVTISCDKILVFKGISPNGDGRNDTWHILGIEQFPDNTVQVFNRWGNLVFEQKYYTNATAWGGQWNEKDLPDGTYFYLIELGGNAGKLSGWLQILR